MHDGEGVPCPLVEGETLDRGHGQGRAVRAFDLPLHLALHVRHGVRVVGHGHARGGVLGHRVEGEHGKDRPHDGGSVAIDAQGDAEHGRARTGRRGKVRVRDHEIVPVSHRGERMEEVGAEQRVDRLEQRHLRLGPGAPPRVPRSARPSIADRPQGGNARRGLRCCGPRGRERAQARRPGADAAGRGWHGAGSGR